MRFSKELLLALIAIVGIFDAIQKRRKVIFESVDLFIILYVLTLLFVSFFQKIPIV